MARKDALLKIHKRLLARRQELLCSIAEDLGDLQHEWGGNVGKDEADVATDSINNEMFSQLAEMESRELIQINRALLRMRDGSYGNCEVCGVKIPVERLNALNYTTLCIKCQRELETNPTLAEELEANWQKLEQASADSGLRSSVKAN